MDKLEIKRQIAYWEGMLKDGERQVKVLQEQNGTIKSTIKTLKALLGKDEKPVEQNMADGFASEEVR